MALYVATLEAAKPYKTHFRKMDLILTANTVGEAQNIIESMMEVLHLGDSEITELYRDNKALDSSSDNNDNQTNSS